MPGIVVRYNESIDSALKGFKKQMEKGGVFSEREFYERPSDRKKKRLFASRKRFVKRLEETKASEASAA